jgi:hypothetical protein
VLEKVQEFTAGQPAENDVTAIALARSAAGNTFATVNG